MQWLPSLFEMLGVWRAGLQRRAGDRRGAVESLLMLTSSPFAFMKLAGLAAAAEASALAVEGAWGADLIS